jgi:hypothetical protein
VAWEVEVTDEFKDWYQALSQDEQDAIVAAVEVLEEEGPSLGRPLVDRIHASRHHNMKELRPMKDYMRVLFAFDPRRVAILLVAGTKEGKWNAWYDEMVTFADEMYDAHLAALREEGLL